MTQERALRQSRNARTPVSRPHAVARTVPASLLTPTYLSGEGDGVERGEKLREGERKEGKRMGFFRGREVGEGGGGYAEVEGKKKKKKKRQKGRRGGGVSAARAIGGSLCLTGVARPSICQCCQGKISLR